MKVSSVPASHWSLRYVHCNWLVERQSTKFRHSRVWHPGNLATAKQSLPRTETGCSELELTPVSALHSLV